MDQHPPLVHLEEREQGDGVCVCVCVCVQRASLTKPVSSSPSLNLLLRSSSVLSSTPESSRLTATSGIEPFTHTHTISQLNHLALVVSSRVVMEAPFLLARLLRWMEHHQV